MYCKILQVFPTILIFHLPFYQISPERENGAGAVRMSGNLLIQDRSSVPTHNPPATYPCVRPSPIQLRTQVYSQDIASGTVCAFLGNVQNIALFIVWKCIIVKNFYAVKSTHVEISFSAWRVLRQLKGWLTIAGTHPCWEGGLFLYPFIFIAGNMLFLFILHLICWECAPFLYPFILIAGNVLFTHFFEIISRQTFSYFLTVLSKNSFTTS